MLTAFFIVVHTRFVRELTHLPEGVEVVVFTIDSEPLARYDNFSNTDRLIESGRTNVEIVLDFWQSGGVGDRNLPVGDIRRPVAGPYHGHASRSALISEGADPSADVR